MEQLRGSRSTLVDYILGSVPLNAFWRKLLRDQKNSNKTYRTIQLKWEEYYRERGPAEDVAVQELRHILQHDSVSLAVLSSLLAEAVKDELDPGDKRTLLIVKAICGINAQAAFEQVGGANKENTYTPFGIASGKGYTSIVEVMSDELANFNIANSQKLNAEAATNEDIPQIGGNLSQKGEDISKEHNNQSGIDQVLANAFNLAASNLKLDVLKLLSEHRAFKGEKLADANSVRNAISRMGGRNSPSDLEAFKFIMGMPQLTKAESMDIWTEAVKVKVDDVVQHLLEAKPTEFATHQCARLLIEMGTATMWKLFSKSAGNRLKDMLEQGHLLHIAVESRNTDVVQAILDNFRKLAGVGRKARDAAGAEYLEYPVEMLKAKPDAVDLQADSSYMKIRNLLLQAMIRSSSNDLGIKEIKAILRRAKVDVKTMGLYLSHVNTGEQSFAEYVEWLQAQDDSQNKIFEFESVLKYARFPDLNTQISGHIHDLAASMRSTHTEIRMMFEWLKKRGVIEVLEISVPDRLFCPHSDDDIAMCMDDFAVRVLKWRKLDLYLGGIKKKGHLREIHLYSSGNPSVHDQWYRELPNFPKLKRLYVYVVTNVLSSERAESVKMDLESGLKRLKATGDNDQNSELKLARAKLKANVAYFDWDMDTRRKVYRKLDEITNEVVGPNLSAFIDKYRGIMAARRNSQKEKMMTRIALIDSGVVIVGGKRNDDRGSSSHKYNDRSNVSDAERYTWQANNQASRRELLNKDEQMLRQHNEEEEEDEPMGQQARKNPRGWTDDLATRVDAGKSFVTTGSDEEQVWWHASEPHGTQMARLICSVDPECRLFVAKVAETRKPGISADLVAEAIEWAIDQKVDIISLSLVTYTASKSLKRAIQRAEGNDIVILTSSVDEGFKEVKDSFHKGGMKHNVLTIAACDQWGNLLDRSQKTGYDYCFVGNDVEVGQVPFLKSPESISGSSVATAIAAGVVSLIISFCRLANEDQAEMYGRWRTNITRERLEKMMGTNYQYVVLEHICGDKKQLRNTDFMHEIKTKFTGRDSEV